MKPLGNDMARKQQKSICERIILVTKISTLFFQTNSVDLVIPGK